MWPALIAGAAQGLGQASGGPNTSEAGPSRTGDVSISYSRSLLDLDDPAIMLGLAALVLVGILAWRKLGR